MIDAQRSNVVNKFVCFLAPLNLKFAPKKGIPDTVFSAPPALSPGKLGNSAGKPAPSKDATKTWQKAMRMKNKINDNHRFLQRNLKSYLLSQT